MHIRKIEIRNYQSLEDVRLDLGNFTVITGETDTGKSSLIRAMRGLVNNARGSSFVRRGARDAEVLAFVGDHIVIWRKGKSNNYRLDGRTFEKMGVAVPDEIQDILRMGSVRIADQRYPFNFHDQFAVPFLLTESGPGITRVLGEISGVNLVHLAAKLASRDVQRTNTKVKEARSSLEILQERLKDSRGVLERQKLMKAATGRGQQLVSWCGLLEDASSVAERMTTCGKRKSKLQAILSGPAAVVPEGLDELIRQGESLERAGRVITEIKRLQERVLLCSYGVATDRQVVVYEERVKIGARGLGELSWQSQQYARLREIEIAYTAKEAAVVVARTEIGDLEKEQKALALELKECPLCGAELLEGLEI